VFKFSLPGSFVEWGKRAGDDFPARDGEAGAGEPRDAADENLYENHCNADNEPDTDELFVFWSHIFTFKKVVFSLRAMTNVRQSNLTFLKRKSPELLKTAGISYKCF